MKPLILEGDDPNIVVMMSRPGPEQLRSIIGRNKIVFIDEAQKIPVIGLTSKIIVDQFKDVQLILSGSSSFDLMEQLINTTGLNHHRFSGVLRSNRK